MIDIEQARSNSEHSEPPAPLKLKDTVRIVLEGDEWHGKTGIIRQLRGNGKGGFAQAGVEISPTNSTISRRYFAFEDLIAVPADDAKLDTLIEAHEPTPAPETTVAIVAEDSAFVPLYTLPQHVAIERPGGEYTIGIPGVIETVERFEIKTLGDVLTELGKAKERIAALEKEVADSKGANWALHQELTDKNKSLGELHASQQMTPLARTGGAVEVCYFCEVVNTMANQTDAAYALGKLRSENWSIAYEQFIIDNGWTKHHVARLERQLRAVESKPETDKPGNVRDFPVPDADLTTEDDGKGALACVPAAKGLGRGVGARRA